MVDSIAVVSAAVCVETHDAGVGGRLECLERKDQTGWACRMRLLVLSLRRGGGSI